MIRNINNLQKDTCLRLARYLEVEKRTTAADLLRKAVVDSIRQ
jgi:hypothetical protein